MPRERGVNRAERRRHERAARRPPVLIAGEGIVAAALGHRYEARPHAELAAKVPGRHRWIASGAWVLSDVAVEGAHDPDVMKFLDNENLMHIGIGCCERPLGAITVDSVCPADGAS
jgi:hypothetical protein